jgi:hypothetical protein
MGGEASARSIRSICNLKDGDLPVIGQPRRE